MIVLYLFIRVFNESRDEGGTTTTRWGRGTDPTGGRTLPLLFMDLTTKDFSEHIICLMPVC